MWPLHNVFKCAAFSNDWNIGLHSSCTCNLSCFIQLTVALMNMNRPRIIMTKVVDFIFSSSVHRSSLITILTKTHSWIFYFFLQLKCNVFAEKTICFYLFLFYCYSQWKWGLVTTASYSITQHQNFYYTTAKHLISIVLRLYHFSFIHFYGLLFISPLSGFLDWGYRLLSPITMD